MKHVHYQAALGRIAAEDQGFGWETAAAQVARRGGLTSQVLKRIDAIC